MAVLAQVSFHKLPHDVLESILEFCDGKSLSTLLLAACGCPDLFVPVEREIREILTRRLTGMARRIQAHETNQPHLGGATAWIRSIAQISAEEEEEDSSSSSIQNITRQIRYISENLAVSDFLHESLTHYSQEGQFEWPMWCGQLTIESFHEGSRRRHNARIILTAPMQRPSLLPSGASLLKHHVPCSNFRCEPYNLIPVPPWGHVRGLTEDDTAILRPVIRHLEETHQVAVPSGYQSFDSLDVRIVSKRRAPSSWRLPTSWIIERTEYPLLCCWHDDSSDLSNDRDYIPYVIDLLKARDRLYHSQEPSERIYNQ
ncbi:hypothetical protein FisN_14Hu088 [Fistulifera solaris]|uniref:F-box domain-containing protein n=1 Tax=Fistulifera solaris TaxID=1519565 RepID=A0A1Z5K888_FISSO|nr:hypothetical protein FisN_14Hu088 [Fistulifera solaris]|eukprot:GAX22473.1 hypothetical protein FisN_14Hu088 [Fistulifera solaris]